MKVSWDYHSQYMTSHKIHVPKHQAVNHVLPNTGGLPWFNHPKNMGWHPTAANI
jgi:hypothetical protein